MRHLLAVGVSRNTIREAYVSLGYAGATQSDVYNWLCLRQGWESLPPKLKGGPALAEDQQVVVRHAAKQSAGDEGRWAVGGQGTGVGSLAGWLGACTEVVWRIGSFVCFVEWTDG